MSFNLVVQAPAVSPAQLQALSTLARANPVEQITPQAWCLRDADPAGRSAVADYCEAESLDFAFIPYGRALADFGLLVSDMDSTMIKIECIDEIADMIGVKPQVAAITARSMAGEIDFAESLRQRVALLEGLEEAALHRVYDERLQLMDGAEELIALCKKNRVKTLLISGGFTHFTDRLREQLGLDYAVANTLEVVGGRLTGRLVGDIVDAQAKADWLVKLRDELNLRPDQTIAMGDGANDLKMLAAAGLGIGMHPKPIVRQHADVSLRFVGLEGVARLFGEV